MPFCCIRGAITVPENTKEAVLEKTKILLLRIIEKNNIDIADIISIHFTATRDIDAVYPAVVAREIGIKRAALMCMQEMYVEGSLCMCVRVSMMLESCLCQNNVKHMYLEGASFLRPDLLDE